MLTSIKIHITNSHIIPQLILALLVFNSAFFQCSVKADLVDYEVMSKSFGDGFAKGRKAQIKGDYEGAVAEYSKAIDANPEAMQLYMYRAGCLINLNKNKQALDDVEKYNKLLQRTNDKNDKSMLAAMTLTKARALDGLGRIEDALKYYKQSIELKDFSIAHRQLGKLYEKNGQLELALTELVKYRESLPPNSTPEYRKEIDENIRRLQLEMVEKHSAKKIGKKKTKGIVPD